MDHSVVFELCIYSDNGAIYTIALAGLVLSLAQDGCRLVHLHVLS